MKDDRPIPAPEAIRPTSRSLPIALLRAREAVMVRIRPMLAERGLTEQQWRVLRVLDEAGPLDATEIADQSCILTPSMTRILKALEGRGMVRREKHATDGRRSLIHITEAASGTIRAAAPESNRIYAELVAAFGEEHMDALLDMLERLARTGN